MKAQDAQPERAKAIAIARNRGTEFFLICEQNLFLFLAAGFFLVTFVSLLFTGSGEQGLYVGIWIPSVLSVGALLLEGSRNE